MKKRRSLSTVLVVAAVFAVGAQTASGLDFKISQQAEIAVTNHFLYWVKIEPGHCKNCSELWRVPVAGGAQERVARVQHGDFSFLEGGGDVLAYTSIHTSSRLRTRVHAIADDGRAATIARATFRPHSRRNCGSLISSEAVSSQGEVAWQQVDMPKPVFDCSTSDVKLSWSAHAGGLGLPARELLAPRNVNSLVLALGDPFDALIELNPIASYEASRLVTMPTLGLPLMYATPNGRPLRYKPTADVDSIQSLDLSPSGAVLGVFYKSQTLDPDPVDPALLFPRPFDPTSAVDLEIAGFDNLDLHFCGDSIAQLSVAKKSFRFTLRSSDGSILRSTDYPFKGGEPEGTFRCNEELAFLQLGTWSDSGREALSKTFSVPIQ